MGKNSINMRRVTTKVHELFDGEIDMSDFPNDTSNHFETRALAAVALMMMAGLEASQASILQMVTMIWGSMPYT